MSKSKRGAAEVQKAHLSISTQFSGPLPPPAWLERYEAILPGAAERLLALWERQSAHRQGIENVAMTSNAGAQRRGQVFGFVIGLVGLVGGFVLVILGKDAAGYASVITSISALAAVYVVGKIANAIEMARKRATLAKIAAPPKEG